MTLSEAWSESNNVAKCSNNRARLCKFSPYYDDGREIAERCEFCGKQVAYRVIDGRVDNAKYLRDHVRDFLQPHGRTANLFFEIYGTSGLERAQDFSAKKKQAFDKQDFLNYARETYKTAKKAYS